MKTNNKILKSLIIKADALDFQDRVVADGSLAVYDLSALSPLRATVVYKELTELVRNLRQEVVASKKSEAIAHHESEIKRLNKELKQLKTEEDK